MRNRYLPLLLALVLLGSDSGFAQFKKIKNVLKREPTEEQQARQRAKVAALALELYETDPDFKDAVDSHYREVLKNHSERAYQINTSKPSEVVVIREDRFRRHRDDQLALYDNLAVQSYVNRLGQRFAPADSNTLFTFRLVATPIPYAEAVQTGYMGYRIDRVHGLQIWWVKLGTEGGLRCPGVRQHQCKSAYALSQILRETCTR